MAFDHSVDVRDYVQGLLERVGQRQHAAARHGIDERRHLPREHVSGGHRARDWKDHERVAIGVAGPEVIEVDPIVAAPQRHPVGERPVRHRRRVRRDTRVGGHPLPCVLVRDHVDRRREVLVAADVIWMRMRIDDHRHRLVGDCTNLIQDRLAVVWELRVDEHDAALRHEHRRVSAGTGNNVQVVADLLDRAGRRNARALLLRRRASHRKTHHDDRRKKSSACHQTTGHMNALVAVRAKTFGSRWRRLVRASRVWPRRHPDPHPPIRHEC